MMKTFDEINVEEALNEEDFTTLVGASPLTPSEIENIPTFFKLYCKFLDAGSTPLQCWMALRNIIILKRAQDEFESQPIDLKMKSHTGDIPLPPYKIAVMDGVMYQGTLNPVAPMTQGA